MSLNADERVPNSVETFDDDFKIKYFGTAHRTGVKFIDNDTAIIDGRYELKRGGRVRWVSITTTVPSIY